MDIYPNIKYTINKKNNLYAAFHLFYLAEDYYDIPVGGDYSYLSRDIGGELDICYTYIYDKSFQIKLYLGYYQANNTTEYIKKVSKDKSTTPIWSALMLTYKPSFFKQ